MAYVEPKPLQADASGKLPAELLPDAASIRLSVLSGTTEQLNAAVAVAGELVVNTDVPAAPKLGIGGGAQPIYYPADNTAIVRDRANHTGKQLVSTLLQSGAAVGQTITWNGTSWVVAGPVALSQKVEIFLAPGGVYTLPPGAKTVRGFLIGCGGAGASGAKGAVGGTTRFGGSAGGNGAILRFELLASELPSTVTIGVGVAPSGGVPQTNNNSPSNAGVATALPTNFGNFFRAGSGGSASNPNGAAGQGEIPGGAGPVANSATANNGGNSLHFLISGVSGTGGGVTTTEVAQPGGNGGTTNFAGGAEVGGLGGLPEINGGNGLQTLATRGVYELRGIPGSGGGAGSVTGNAGAGAHGKHYGAGGAGGGASTNSVGDSGAGGDGGPGIAVIITTF